MSDSRLPDYVKLSDVETAFRDRLTNLRRFAAMADKYDANNGIALTMSKINELILLLENVLNLKRY